MSLARKAILQDRAQMLRLVRSFFEERKVLEVDCNHLVRHPALDANIDVMSASVTDRQTGYLHTSPEYAMKRLLAEGLGDLFFLGHVYRKGEIGRLHNPEFTMVEWYRIEVPYRQFIEDTCHFIMLFLGSMPVRFLSYREAFQLYAGIDPFTAPNPTEWDRRSPSINSSHNSQERGTAKLKQSGPNDDSIATGSDEEEAQSDTAGASLIPDEFMKGDRDTWLHYVLSHQVEEKLGQGELTVLCEYPESQAALARLIEKDGYRVAERFEIYHKGVELSNGYHELIDAAEQRRRFEAENEQRRGQQKEPYSLDEKFLSALESGLPDCCGVSVGFDRLMLLRHNAASLRDILPFAWEEL